MLFARKFSPTGPCVRNILSHLLHIFFPENCRYCLKTCAAGSKTLCAECFSELTLASGSDRCHHCFHSNIHCQASHFCPKTFIDIERYAFCFEKSPILHLLEHAFLRKNALETGLSAIAGFFALQHLLLDFPKPHAVLSYPTGNNSLLHNTFLAEEVCRILSVPTLLSFKNSKLQEKNLLTPSERSHILCLSDHLDITTLPFLTIVLKSHGWRSLTWLSLHDEP